MLPEVALTGQGEDVGSVAQWSYPLAGAVQDTFAREARKCHCYIVATTYLQEGGATKRCSNAAILFDRSGEVVGIYRKVQLVVDTQDRLHGAWLHAGQGRTRLPVRLRQAGDTDLLRHGF